MTDRTFPQSQKVNRTPAVTDEERDQLREEFDEVLLKPIAGHKSKFHIKHPEIEHTSICVKNSALSKDVDFRPKNIDAYPKSWDRDWCKNCLALWREGVDR